MKNGKRTLYILTSLIVLFLVSCAPGFFQRDTDNVTTGTVAVRLPGITERLATLFEALGTSGSTTASRSLTAAAVPRAVGMYDSVYLELYQYNPLGTPIDSFWVSTAPMIGETEPLGWNGQIPGGDSYYMKATVYNSAVSTTEPTAFGTSAAFSVVAGEITTVDIVCFPYNPTPAISGTPYTFSMVPSSWTWPSWESPPNILSIGQEKWFSITPDPSGYTTIRVAPDTTDAYDTAALVMIFDQTGMPMDYALSSGVFNEIADGPAENTLGLYGPIAYVCIGALTFSGEASSNLTFEYGPGQNPDDAAAPAGDNNTSANSVAMVENTPYTGTWVTNGMISPGEEDWYSFNVEPVAGSAVTVNLTITNPEDSLFGLSAEVMDATEMTLGWMDLMSEEQSASSITFTGLSQGWYYVRIGGGDGPFGGAEYEVSWQYASITDDPFEDNDDSTTATLLAPDTQVNAVFWDDDYYLLDVPAAGDVTVFCTFAPGATNIGLEFWGGGSGSAWADPASGGEAQIISNVPAGTYYLRVYSWDSMDRNGTPYRLWWTNN